jgi:hypothetical protein
MQRIGNGNDLWMIFLTIAVSMVVCTILFDGPADAVGVLNSLVGDVVRGALQVVSAWLS